MVCLSRRSIDCRRESWHCRCVNLFILAALLGSLGYLTISLYERYLLQQALQSMRSSLDEMQRVVAVTGQAYDDLHNEIDRLTGETIPKTFLIEEETNYRDDAMHKDSETQSPNKSNKINEAQSDSKLSLASGDQFNKGSQFTMPLAKQPLDVNDKIGLSPSLECNKKCMFLPVGEYCDRENCKNRDVYLDMTLFKKDYIEKTNNGKSATAIASSSKQKNSKTDHKTSFEKPSNSPRASKRKPSKAKVDSPSVRDSHGRKEAELEIWCSESKCTCGDACQARKKYQTN